MIHRRTGAQRGTAALELVAGLAVLVLPVTCAVLGLPGWARHQEVARLAARAAGRVVTLRTVCDRVAARAAAQAVVDDLQPGADLELRLGCDAGEPVPRGDDVSVRATLAIPTLTIPALGSVAAWRWTTVQVVTVDPYAAVP